MSSLSRRLFVPLASAPFEWFASGRKRWELRKRVRQFTERHVFPGRIVELRCGYSQPARAIWGAVDRTEIANSLREFFLRVPFEEVIPSSSTVEEAIQTAAAILRVGPEEPVGLIGFRVTRTVPPIKSSPVDNQENAVILLSRKLMSKVAKGEKTSTVRRGQRHYRVGPATLKSGQIEMPIEIETVGFSTFRALTDQEAKLDGYKNLGELHHALRAFYPEISDGDDVTVVRFRTRERKNGAGIH